VNGAIAYRSGEDALGRSGRFLRRRKL
jgi:hypothetical protein